MVKKTFVLTLAVISFAGAVSLQQIKQEAWDSLKNKEYEKAQRFADQCYEQVKKKAREMQASYDKSKRPYEYWALNDAAECLYIKATAYKNEGKLEDATKVYKLIITDYPNGYFPDDFAWGIKEAAEKELKEIGK